MLIRSAVNVAALLALAVPTQAEQLCGLRYDIIRVLAAKYQEVPRYVGIAGSRAFMEIYISEKGSWTMLTTEPYGLTCIRATGDSWEALPPTERGEKT